MVSKLGTHNNQKLIIKKKFRLNKKEIQLAVANSLPTKRTPPKKKEGGGRKKDISRNEHVNEHDSSDWHAIHMQRPELLACTWGELRCNFKFRSFL